MKRKLIILSILGFLFFGGCEERPNRIKENNSDIRYGTVSVEPIKVQGSEHDFIL